MAKSFSAADVVELTADELATAAAAIAEKIIAVKPERLMEQKLLVPLQRIEALADHMKSQVNAAKDALKKHIEGGGRFQAGPVAVTFPVTTRRTPPWKAIAVDTAKALFEEKRWPFSVDGWVEQIVAKTPAATSTSCHLTLSEGV